MIAGLDDRFGWSIEYTTSFQILALILVLSGYLFATWAMVENRYFSAMVRIQKDRNQTVVSSGPYQYVPHPAYSGSIIVYLVLPVMLGSIWARVPAGLIIVGLIFRTAFEDRMLQEDLEEYRVYARKVKYRLLPGLW